jgi:hypothetical protein
MVPHCYVLYQQTDAATDGEMMVICEKKKTPELIEPVGRPYTYLMGTMNAMEIGLILALHTVGSHEASLDAACRVRKRKGKRKGAIVELGNEPKPNGSSTARITCRSEQTHIVSEEKNAWE